jgi:hypothetical protein
MEEVTVFRLPTALLSAVSVISLAGMGMGYTLWADRLTVNGTIHTGIVDVAYTSAAAVEAAEVEGKDVGNCSVALSAGVIGNAIIGGVNYGNQGTPPGGNVDTGPDQADITINNAYPFYACDISLTVSNVGTIPVKLQQLVITNPDPVALTITQGACWANEFQLEATASQTPPGGTFVNSATCTIHIQVNEEASENTTYSFTTNFLAHQWNEAAP